MAEQYLKGLKKACDDIKKDNSDYYKDKAEPFFEINEAGERIAGVEYMDKRIYYNSIYDSEKLIDVWCKKYEINNYRNITAVFGIANTAYIRKLRKINSEMLIVVYEPSHKLMTMLHNKGMLEDIDKDDNTIIVVGENVDVVYQIMSTVINIETYKYVNLYVSPNYELIYDEEIDEIIKCIESSLNFTEINRNTILITKDEINNNIVKNIPDAIEQYMLIDLKREFDKIDLENIPAIIVAAGPSLDKNINDLKEAKGKAFIIAVDTALNALAKAEIRPDIAITVDPHKPISLFKHEKMQDVPIVFQLCSNNEICSFHKGKRIYHQGSESILDKFNIRFNKDSIILETGGSVANDAYSLAQKLGFKTIIFVGQDLAYPNDKEHSDASYGELVNNYITDNGKVYFYVDDVYGGKVKTEYNMNCYRQWFERVAKLYSDIHYIDATEGGARIEGFEIMTLKQAIQETCTNAKKIDFEEIINGIDVAYTDNEKNEIYSYISNLSEDIVSIKKIIRDGLTAYHRLDEYNRKEVYSGKGFENTINKITEINKLFSEDKEYAYLALYTAEEDFETRKTVFDEKESLYEEMNHIIKNGKKMLNSFLDSVDKFYEDMTEVIEYAKEKCEVQ